MAYDFVNLGLDGVSAYVDYISGNWAVDDQGDSLPEKSETDVNIDTASSKEACADPGCGFAHGAPTICLDWQLLQVIFKIGSENGCRARSDSRHD